MNPKPILLIALFLFTQFTFSQERQTEKPSKATLGINLGGSLSKFRGNHESERYSAKTGFLIGVNFEYALGKNTALKTNINYESRTYGIAIYIQDIGIGVEPGWRDDADFKMEYITVPVLFKYSFGKKQQFFVNAGPFASFLTSKTSYKSPNLGIAAGVGTQFKVGKGTLVFEVRNNLGLTDYLGKLKDDGYDINHDLRSNSLNLIAAWNFDL